MKKHISQAMISLNKEGTHLLRAQFSFSKDSEFFLGHFPKNPLVPGIIQIEMVKFVLETFHQKEYKIKEVKKAKFLKKMEPEDLINLEMKIKEVEDFFLLQGIFKLKGEVATHLSLVLNQLS